MEVWILSYFALELWNLIQVIPHHYFVAFLKDSSQVEIIDYYSKSRKYEAVAGPFIQKTLDFFLKRHEINPKDIVRKI